MPHAIDQEALGFQCYGPDLDNCWETLVWEYRAKEYPHLILVTAQTSHGTNGTITQGELAAIVTAMRNRAQEPISFDEEDPDNPETFPNRQDPNEADLRFKDEKRFPVCPCIFPSQATS